MTSPQFPANHIESERSLASTSANSGCTTGLLEFAEGLADYGRVGKSIDMSHVIRNLFPILRGEEILFGNDCRLETTVSQFSVNSGFNFRFAEGV